jgi:anti-sigma factor RsiW
MNPHLSNEDLARYLAGEETLRAQAHLNECAECRRGASALVSMVGGARAAVAMTGSRADANFWARQRNAVRDRIALRRRRHPSWALAAALAALLIASTFMFRTQEPRPDAGVVSNTAPTPKVISDDALLSSVNEAIEQDVPTALAPLQQLAYEREQAQKNSQQN